MVNSGVMDDIADLSIDTDTTWRTLNMIEAFECVNSYSNRINGISYATFLLFYY